MKQINRMIWLFLVSLLPIACFEDDNKYEYVKLDEIVIEGIERSYVRKSHQDILSITPTGTTMLMWNMLGNFGLQSGQMELFTSRIRLGGRKI